MKYDREIDDNMVERILHLDKKGYSYSEIAETLKLNVIDVIDFMIGYETELDK